MVTVLGFSEAVLTMIMDNFESCGLYPKLKVINNLGIKATKGYLIHGFDVTMDTELSGDEQNLFLGGAKVHTKIDLAENFNPDINKMINIVNNSVEISSSVVLGRGILINSFVSISAYSSIGNYVTINRNSSIGHHTEIGDFCTINPGCHIAGNVKIGKNTAIGMGSLIRDGITIGENCVIGMGSVIVKDVPDYTKVVQKL